jgi:nucleoside-diphosphate-sugar epimerase
MSVGPRTAQTANTPKTNQEQARYLGDPARFIGSRAVAPLRAEHHEVRVLDSLPRVARRTRADCLDAGASSIERHVSDRHRGPHRRSTTSTQSAIRRRWHSAVAGER